MKKRNLLIGLTILIALIAVLFAVRHFSSQYEAKQAVRDMLLPYTADRIIAVSYQTPSSAASYVRDNGVWRDTAAPAGDDSEESSSSDPDSGTDSADNLQLKAGEMAASVTGVRLYQTLENVTDPGLYGLDDPRCVIFVTDSDGKVTKISVGNDNDTTSTVYCCLDDDTGTVYAVSTSLTAKIMAQDT